MFWILGLDLSTIVFQSVSRAKTLSNSHHTVFGLIYYRHLIIEIRMWGPVSPHMHFSNWIESCISTLFLSLDLNFKKLSGHICCMKNCIISQYLHPGKAKCSFNSSELWRQPRSTQYLAYHVKHTNQIWQPVYFINLPVKYYHAFDRPSIGSHYLVCRPKICKLIHLHDGWLP